MTLPSWGWVGDGRVAMRRVNWFLLTFLLIVGSGLFSSCTEDSVTSVEDRIGPSTEILYPVSALDNQTDISDSVDVYVKARDNTRVARVEIWITLESEDAPELLQTLTNPLSLSQIPDSLKPDDGSDVYRVKWVTVQIRNGTKVRLFSRAYDTSGNEARSELVIVRILNEGVPSNPPNADFTWTPQNGTYEDVFTFDASLTTDDIDPIEQIHVRWDFDSDGTWDRDWDPTLFANTPVTHQYPLARVYTVTLEAKNTYLLNRVGVKELALEVTNVGNELNPQEPEEMIRIPSAIYPVGTADTSLVYADEDEYPLHRALMTTDFYIRRTEVPNYLYVRFLRQTMSEDDPIVRRTGNEVWYYPNLVEPVEEDSIPRIILHLSRSAIFYDPDSLSMRTRPEDSDLPVVGVSWFGAKAYSEHWGLRLPTEHEWEIAAKGELEGYLYPWGDTISVSQANYNDPENPYRELRPIGSYAEWASPLGILDLSGNAKEWVKDWYGPYSAGQESNPAGPIFGEKRVIRGGSYLTTFAGVRVTAREAEDPNITSDQIGFRTAYTAPVGN